MIARKPTRAVEVGNIEIGGNNPVVVQSMTNTPTTNVEATLEQINRLADRGCELVRVAVPDSASAESLPEIVNYSSVPIVGDIHYSPDLALMAIDGGVAKLRLNPGNITDEGAIREIASSAANRSIPIRVGVNSGSLDREIVDKYGRSPEAMVASATRELELLESQGFEDIVVSLKSSEVNTTIEANERFSEKYDYPIHLGITEAGGGRSGIVKSAIGIGALLRKGIGDTIRVSLTANPREEVSVAYDILGSLGIRNRGIDIVSCPTCARTEIDVEGAGKQLENRLESLSATLQVALMGCSVNGIGEADSANLGIVGTAKGGVLYIDGEQEDLIASSDTRDLVDQIEERIRDYLNKGD